MDTTVAAPGATKAIASASSNDSDGSHGSSENSSLHTAHCTLGRCSHTSHDTYYPASSSSKQQRPLSAYATTSALILTIPNNNNNNQHSRLFLSLQTHLPSLRHARKREMNKLFLVAGHCHETSGLVVTALGPGRLGSWKSEPNRTV